MRYFESVELPIGAQKSQAWRQKVNEIALAACSGLEDKNRDQPRRLCAGSLKNQG